MIVTILFHQADYGERFDAIATLPHLHPERALVQHFKSELEKAPRLCGTWKTLDVSVKGHKLNAWVQFDQFSDSQFPLLINELDHTSMRDRFTVIARIDDDGNFHRDVS